MLLRHYRLNFYQSKRKTFYCIKSNRHVYTKKMPRRKPTEKLGTYGQFDLNPERAVELFVESKLQNKFFIKPPYWDIPREGLELYAIQNERDHGEMSKLQENLRKQAQIDARCNEERIAAVYEIKNELRHQFISVNDFIRECERKKTDAEEKLFLEAKACDEKKEEIKNISQDLIALTEFKERLEKSVDELHHYKAVFEKVVAESECFTSLKELIDRCDALMITQVEVTEMEENKKIQIEAMRKKIVDATNDASLIIMGLNKELSDLEQSYNASQTESFKWSKVLAVSKECIKDNESSTTQLLDQIQQLYALFCKRNDIPIAFERHQIEEQLDYIKEEMKYLQDVIKCAAEISENEDKSTIAQNGSIRK